jgi:hypothetical protein
MRAEDDRAPRLHGEQDLVDGGGGRVGGRDDRGDHAEGFGDLDDLLLVDPPHDPDGLHRADEVVDLLGREEVLLDLVGDDAVAGFLDGETGERFGLRRDGGGHRIHDGVDLFLGQLGQRRGGFPGTANERAGFADRREIAIGLDRWLSHA